MKDKNKSKLRKYLLTDELVFGVEMPIILEEDADCITNTFFDLLHQ